MLGAIAGDIIGSIYEGSRADRLDFSLLSPSCHFTDDTVLTVATADAILSKTSYEDKYREYFRAYPHAGYGGGFKMWGYSSDPQPYNSFGNGSAMRVSPVAYTSNDINVVLKEAARSAGCTHNHPEGIKGAQAVAVATFWARVGYTKKSIRKEIENQFIYNLSDSVTNLHRHYRFDVTCQGSVPQAIIAFLESDGFESAIRNAIYIGGDSDTIACMTGAIAEAYYGGVPQEILAFVYKVLDSRLASIARRFQVEYVADRIAREGK